MVHAQISDKYIHFALMYTADNIFPVVPIKNLVNQDGEPTTPQILATDTEPSALNLCALLCQYFVRKATTQVDTKALNMSHQSQKGFRDIFLGIPQHQKGYLIYVPIT